MIIRASAPVLVYGLCVHFGLIDQRSGRVVCFDFVPNRGIIFLSCLSSPHLRVLLFGSCHDSQLCAARFSCAQMARLAAVVGA